MTLRVGVWQCPAQPGETRRNLDRLAAICERAAAERVDVVVTPEMFLTGYAIPEDVTGRLAEPVGGPLEAAVIEVADRSGVAIAYGFPEAGPGGAIFNTAALVDGGRVIGRHRKLHLFGAIDRRRFTPAPEPSGVVDLRGHRVGLLICYDIEFPEPARALRLQGAEILLVPTANMTGYETVNSVLLPARAVENGCFLAYANYCGTEADLTYCGLSTICAPTGITDQAPEDGEVLLVADLDTRLVDDGYLIDRRGDLYDSP